MSTIKRNNCRPRITDSKRGEYLTTFGAVCIEDPRWCAFEIKLGANQIDTASENMLKVERQFRADPKGKPPAVLCVICGPANAAYKCADDVFVIPITTRGLARTITAGEGCADVYIWKNRR